MGKKGGFPGGAMPGNMNNLMKQAQRMQRQMEEKQKEMEEKEWEASAGGGAVTVKVSGKKEIDAICDGKDVYIPGIMQLVEATGVHSGDSMSVYPPYSLNDKVKKTIEEYTVKLGLAIGIKGLFNIQFIVDKNNNVSVIEVNPRSSRSVPFLSKSTGVPMANVATKVMLGDSLKKQGYKTGVMEEKNRLTLSGRFRQIKKKAAKQKTV